MHLFIYVNSAKFKIFWWPDNEFFLHKLCHLKAGIAILEDGKIICFRFRVKICEVGWTFIEHYGQHEQNQILYLTRRFIPPFVLLSTIKWIHKISLHDEKPLFTILRSVPTQTGNTMGDELYKTPDPTSIMQPISEKQFFDTWP